MSSTATEVKTSLTRFHLSFRISGAILQCDLCYYIRYNRLFFKTTSQIIDENIDTLPFKTLLQNHISHSGIKDTVTFHCDYVEVYKYGYHTKYLNDK